MSSGPRLADGLEIEETEDGVIVYEESSGRVHYLNQTAAAILMLCDGSREAAEIAAAIAEAFAMDEPPLVATEECLVSLTTENLIKIATPGSDKTIIGDQHL